MTMPARFKLLTCLLVYVSCAHGIMVKFGTKGGPIEPPVPTPELPPAQPYRAPAPVWEPRSNDTPDPNAQWRPQLFIPQPRYTQVVYNPETQQAQSINNAQQFVNAYLPRKPIKAEPVQNYFTPSQILSSQSLPGVGIRYFLPAYVNEAQVRQEQKKQDDAKHNQIETNHVHNDRSDTAHESLWKYEKDAATRRNVRTTPERTATPFVYQWPAFVSSRHR